MPTPSTNRPPESCCSVIADMASIAGVRVPSWTIAVPSRMEVVACASAPSGVSASWAQNSGSHTDVAPRRSASTT